MADDDEKALKDQRIHVLMTEAEVAAIDDWAFAHRIKSRGEAMRRMCQIALTLDERLGPLLDAQGKAVMAAVEAHKEIRKAENPEALREALYKSDLADNHVAMRSIMSLSELAVATAPLRRSGEITQAIALRDDLLKALSKMDPDNREDTQGMKDLLRALGGPGKT